MFLFNIRYPKSYKIIIMRSCVHQWMWKCIKSTPKSHIVIDNVMLLPLLLAAGCCNVHCVHERFIKSLLHLFYVTLKESANEFLFTCTCNNYKSFLCALLAVRGMFGLGEFGYSQIKTHSSFYIIASLHHANQNLWSNESAKVFILEQIYAFKWFSIHAFLRPSQTSIHTPVKETFCCVTTVFCCWPVQYWWLFYCFMCH